MLKMNTCFRSNSYLDLVQPDKVVSLEEGKSHNQTRQLFPSLLMAFHQLVSLGHNQVAVFSAERPVFLSIENKANYPIT